MVISRRQRISLIWRRLLPSPYVDAATLDRRMRDYCARASAKMVKVGAAINYSDRIYRDVADLLRRGVKFPVRGVSTLTYLIDARLSFRP